MTVRLKQSRLKNSYLMLVTDSASIKIRGGRGTFGTLPGGLVYDIQPRIDRLSFYTNHASISKGVLHTQDVDLFEVRSN